MHNNKNANNLAAAVNLCIRYSDRNGKGGYKKTISASECVDFIQDNPRIIKVVNSYCNSKHKNSITTPSTMAAAQFLCERGNLKLADMFFEKVNTGSNIGKTEPVGVLRNMLIRSRMQDYLPRNTDILTLIIVAWNLMIDGKRMKDKKITPPKDGRIPSVKRKR